MRKVIGITSRLDYIAEYQEYRDALDTRLCDYLHTLGITPIILPNNQGIFEDYLKNFVFDGFLLSGGGDLANSPRDVIEINIIEHAIKRNKPILGVCRGMQRLLIYFNETLDKLDNHVAINHEVTLTNGANYIVNSYHNFGFKSIRNPNLEIIARAKDGSIEAFKHKTYKIYGIMWHCERQDSPKELDRNIIREVYEL